MHKARPARRNRASPTEVTAWAAGSVQHRWVVVDVAVVRKDIGFTADGVTTGALKTQTTPQRARRYGGTGSLSSDLQTRHGRSGQSLTFMELLRVSSQLDGEDFAAATQSAQVRCAMSPSKVRASASVSSQAEQVDRCARQSRGLLVGDDGKVGARDDGLDGGELHGIFLCHQCREYVPKGKISRAVSV